MYSQSLLQMADKVDQMNYFDDCADQDSQELRQRANNP